jgi:hypothetical protein
LRAVVAVMAVAAVIAMIILRRKMLLRDVILVLVAVTLVTEISPDLVYFDGCNGCSSRDGFVERDIYERTFSTLSLAM